MNNIIKRALITEKSFKDAGAGKYAFSVNPKSSKEDIAEAIAAAFNVSVISVQTANFKGKVKMSKKGKGIRNSWKKAIVTLVSSQKIDLFEIEDEKEQKSNIKNKNDKSKKAKE